MARVEYTGGWDLMLAYEVGMDAALIGALFLLVSLAGAAQRNRSTALSLPLRRSAWLVEQFFRWLLLLAVVLTIIIAVSANAADFLITAISRGLLR